MSSKKTENESSSSATVNSYTKTWELNIYELNRMPHEIIYDETEIAVSPKVLQNELMCPICLDILKNTMTTKECLHRFCHDCIITALRAGNKECPTCRKKLISKRSLRPDPNFDGIISKIYPNREEYDALHEKVLEKLNKKHLTSIGGMTGSAQKANRQTSRANAQPTAESSGATTNNVNNNEEDNNSNEASAKENQLNTTNAAISNLKLNDTQTGTTTTANSNSNRGNKRNIQIANHSDDSGRLSFYFRVYK